MRNRTLTIITPTKIFSCELGNFYTVRNGNETYSLHSKDYCLTITDDDFDVIKEQIEYNLTRVDKQDILIKL